MVGQLGVAAHHQLRLTLSTAPKHLHWKHLAKAAAGSPSTSSFFKPARAIPVHTKERVDPWRTRCSQPIDGEMIEQRYLPHGYRPQREFVHIMGAVVPFARNFPHITARPEAEADRFTRFRFFSTKSLHVALRRLARLASPLPGPSGLSSGRRHHVAPFSPQLPTPETQQDVYRVLDVPWPQGQVRRGAAWMSPMPPEEPRMSGVRRSPSLDAA